MICIRKTSKVALLASILVASSQNVYAMNPDEELERALALSRQSAPSQDHDLEAVLAASRREAEQEEERRTQAVLAESRNRQSGPSQNQDLEAVLAASRREAEQEEERKFQAVLALSQQNALDFEKKQVQTVLAESKQKAPVLNTDDQDLLDAIALSTQSGSDLNPEVDHDLIYAQSLYDALELEEKQLNDIIAKSLEEHIDNKVSKVQEGRPIEAKDDKAISLGKFFTTGVELQPDRDPVLWKNTHEKIAKQSMDNKPVSSPSINNSPSVNKPIQPVVPKPVQPKPVVNSPSINNSLSVNKTELEKLQAERAKRTQEREEREEKAKADAAQRKAEAEEAAEARREEAQRARLESIQMMEAARQQKK